MKWPIVRLEQLAAQESSSIKIGPFGSQLKKTELVASGIHVVGIENVISNIFDGLGDRYITEEKFSTLRSFEVKSRDVLMTMMGTVGEVAIVPQGTSTSIMDSHLLRFRPNPKLCSSEYVAWLLKGSASTRSVLHGRAHGAIMKGLNSSIVRSLPAPLPPFLEQRRIVEILDQADALRKKRAGADAKAERILPALFIRVFGDPTTNQRGWDVFELGDLCAKITSGSRDWARHTGRGDSFFVRTQDINDGEISNGLLTVDPPSGAEADRTRLCYGDVVVTITGIVGKAAVFRVHRQNVYVSQHVALVRPKPTLEPEYLAAYANFPAGNAPLLARFQYGQTKPGLGFRELRTAKIPLPPIDLQRRFVSQTQNIRALKQSRCRAKAKLEELWAALLQRAFSGDLTATWREGHMKELLAEMKEQAKYLAAHGIHSQRENVALQESLF